MKLRAKLVRQNAYGFDCSTATVGAATEGIFHESLNLATAWNLPVLYVCENNQWQAYVSRRETMRTAVTMRMPASAASGILPTSPAAR